MVIILMDLVIKFMDLYYNKIISYIKKGNIRGLGSCYCLINKYTEDGALPNSERAPLNMTN